MPMITRYAMSGFRSEYRRDRIGILLLTALTATACGADPPRYLDVILTPDGGESTTTGGQPGQHSGVPCEVGRVLQTYCLRCHGMPPSFGAPISLVSYEDLTAHSGVDPSKKVAERAVLRMHDTARPMPPGAAPTVTTSEVAAVQMWVTAGIPPGSCASTIPATPSVCTSGRYWNDNAKGSQLMHPGAACNTCHQSDEDQPTRFQVAGTVYPSAHEPTDCLGENGMKSRMTVEITDATGKTVSLPVNSSGNFLYTIARKQLKLPYTAKVTQNGRERAMSAAQMNGDCNSCHTSSGDNGAPGRIMSP